MAKNKQNQAPAPIDDLLGGGPANDPPKADDSAAVGSSIAEESPAAGGDPASDASAPATEPTKSADQPADPNASPANAGSEATGKPSDAREASSQDATSNTAGDVVIDWHDDDAVWRDGKKVPREKRLVATGEDGRKWERRDKAAK